jgi:hypothetical protein
MITGKVDLEGIERVYRRCWLQGLEILSAGGSGTLKNPAIISLLEKAREDSRSTG